MLFYNYWACSCELESELERGNTSAERVEGVRVREGERVTASTAVRSLRALYAKERCERGRLG